MSKKITYFLILALAVIGVMMRLVPHPANFAPVAAIALFSGYCFSRKTALWLPLAIMLVGDLFIGFYEWQLMLAVYGSLLLVSLIGLAIKHSRNVLNMITAALGSSILFFIVTNFTVWAFSPWYTKDWAGLIKCYTLAVPFFRNTVLSDLFFATVLFGSYALISYFVLHYQAPSLKHHAYSLEKN